MNSKVLTIVFTDIKGFTERTAHGGREFVLKLMAKHDELLRPVIAKYQGTVVKTIGDAFLLHFESPTNAVLCAIMMQEILRTYNQGIAPGEKIEIRVAINTGEVNVLENDILGEPVNVTSRLEGITEANEIWFTEATYLAMNKPEVPTSIVGEFRLKGVPEALKVYRVLLDRESDHFKQVLAAQQERICRQEIGSTSSAISWRGMIAAMVFLALLFGGSWLLFSSWKLQKIREQVKISLQSKNYDAALLKMPSLFQGNAEPGDRELLLEAVNGKLGEYFAEKKVEEGKAFLAKATIVFPIDDISAMLKARFKVQEAFILVSQGKKDEAVDLLDALAKEQAENFDVMLDIATFFSKTGCNWTRTAIYFTKCGRLNPAKALANTEFLAAMDYFVRNDGMENGFEDTHQFIAEHLFDRYKTELEPTLYQVSSAAMKLRWSASRIWQAKKLPVDMFRFYLAELLDPEWSTSATQNLETMKYFQKIANEGIKPDMAQALPACLDAFPWLDFTIHSKDDLIMRLSGTIFRSALTGFLKKAIVDPQNHYRRINALALLNPDEYTPVEEVQHHGANILAYDNGDIVNESYHTVLHSMKRWVELASTTRKMLTEKDAGGSTSASIGFNADFPAQAAKVKIALARIAENEGRNIENMKKSRYFQETLTLMEDFQKSAQAGTAIP
ncbi:MAG: adenylate/guanylate cyclase domain-containing protein [Candidatus Ozemobacteraceae bacterium]